MKTTRKTMRWLPALVLTWACGDGAAVGELAAPPEPTEDAPNVAALIAQLDTEEGYFEAVIALSSVGEVAVPALVAVLDSDSDRVRHGAYQALGRNGAAAAAAVPAVVERLDAAQDGERTLQLSALSGIGTAAAAAAASVERVIGESGSSMDRMMAVDTLPDLIGAGAIPALAAALDDDHEQVRAQALRELARLEARDAPVVARYVELLEDGATDVRSQAANAVAMAAPQDAAAVVGLVDLLDDSEMFVRDNAAKALGAIGGDLAAPAVPELLRLLQDPSERQVRWAAGKALGAIGAAGAEAIPLLVARLADEDHVEQAQAAEALGAFGPLAVAALPHLEPLADHAEISLRWAARRALESIRGEPAS